MSHDPSASKNPLAAYVGNVFLFLVPAALIFLLGIVGASFLKGMKRPEEPKKETAPVAAATAPAAPAPNAAPAAPDSAPAPAAPSGGASAGGIDPAVLALGKASYATCAACHGPDGTGLKVGPSLMAPSLVGSKMLLDDPDKALLVVLKGIAKENMDFMGVMAPLAAALDDEKLAAVLTYLRNEWGNSAPPVTVQQAAAARAKFADVNAPAGVRRADIDAIVEAHK